jgi:hypothetical protein
MYKAFEIRGRLKYGFEIWANVEADKWIQLCVGIRTQSLANWMLLKLKLPFNLDDYIGSQEEKNYNEVR